MSHLYLLRHGQASFNSDHYDRLSPLGLRQAFVTGAWITAHGLRVDQVLVGPRRRHLDTADALLACGPGDLHVACVEALDEFADGTSLLSSAQARLTVDQRPMSIFGKKRLYQDEVRRWSKGASDIPGCIPIGLFRQGLACWLQEIMVQTPNGRRILAVTSAGTIAVLVAHVLGLPNTRVFDLLSVLDNCSLSELIFQPGRVSLRGFNSTHHLTTELMSRL